MSVRDETLCLATVPLAEALSSSVWGRLSVWACGLCHWNNSGTTGSSLTHLRNRGHRVPGPPESGSQPTVVGPGVDPEIWWVMSEDNPFSSCPIVCRWGRVWWWPGLGRT